MNTFAAKLALYLTALNYQGPTDAIKDYVDYNSEFYENDEFVVTAKYARILVVSEEYGRSSCVFKRSAKKGKSWNCRFAFG
ncbi:hypothetical protein [Leptospira santarosai]|uniref:hypothetical protein n=1 Tax=Leptospira santarosai TaxID=28183 RepID=UPI0018AD0F4B|nr:hypothetical protein [Leptospira santarosai]